MLGHLLTFLVFETFEPSFGTLASLLPPKIIASALLEQSKGNLGGATAMLQIPFASTLTAPTLKANREPIKKGDSIGPVLEARSFYAVDLATGTPLLTHDIFTRRPIASIAKLVTAMVILDSHQLDEKVFVSKSAAQAEGSRMWLREGEEITVENLLTGMLVNSGNDAATALAQFDAGEEGAFVAKMNAKAGILGLRNTHFSNAKGFDEKENYSTAFDTILFSRAALQYPFIKKTVAIKTGEVTSVSGHIKHPLESTNELLENPYFKVVGLKTGRTPAAGQSFVALFIGEKNHEILTVVLDSPDRFKETKILGDWIFRNFEFR